MNAGRDPETIRKQIDERLNELSEAQQKIKEFVGLVEPLDPGRREAALERPSEFVRWMEKLDQLGAEIYRLCNEYLEARSKQ